MFLQMFGDFKASLKYNTLLELNWFGYLLVNIAQN